MATVKAYGKIVVISKLKCTSQFYKIKLNLMRLEFCQKCGRDITLPKIQKHITTKPKNQYLGIKALEKEIKNFKWVIKVSPENTYPVEEEKKQFLNNLCPSYRIKKKQRLRK